jgi:hypothetical protein
MNQFIACKFSSPQNFMEAKWALCILKFEEISNWLFLRMAFGQGAHRAARVWAGFGLPFAGKTEGWPGPSNPQLLMGWAGRPTGAHWASPPAGDPAGGWAAGGGRPMIGQRVLCPVPWNKHRQTQSTRSSS